MRFFCGTVFVCCCFAANVVSPTARADAAPEQAVPQDPSKKQTDESEKKQAEPPSALKPPVLRERIPMDALPFVKKKRLKQQLQLPPQATTQPSAPANPNKRPPKKTQPPTRYRSSVYRLQGLGGNAQLSPAMRLHLNHSRAALAPLPSGPLPSGPLPLAPQSSAATKSAGTTAGQRSQTFYPGISRIPSQKPFTNIKSERTGFERYWPLLLEGREDPDTGFIIWRLP